MNKFVNPNDPENNNMKKILKDWVADYLSLKTDLFQIEILEHQCSEPHCVHAETTIEIERYDIIENDKKAYYTIPKPLVFVRKHDIQHMKKIKKS